MNEFILFNYTTRLTFKMVTLRCNQGVNCNREIDEGDSECSNGHKFNASNNDGEWNKKCANCQQHFDYFNYVIINGNEYESCPNTDCKLYKKNRKFSVGYVKSMFGYVTILFHGNGN